MAAVDTLFEQAIQLSERARGELIARLLRSLESPADEPYATDVWEAAWSAELDGRMRDLREGKAELVDGEVVFCAARARIAARRP